MLILHILSPGDHTWSKKQLFLGRRDISLTSKGRKQAQKIAKILKDASITAIFSSTNTNARQYAYIIQEQLCKEEIEKAKAARRLEGKTSDSRAAYLSQSKRNAHASIKVHRAPALDNLNMGTWQGKYKEEVVGRYPQEWCQWLESPDSFTFTNGDNPASRHHDFFLFIDGLYSEQLFDQHYLLITHEFFIASLLLKINKETLVKIHQYQIPDASYLIVGYNQNHEYQLLQPLIQVDPFL